MHRRNPLIQRLREVAETRPSATFLITPGGELTYGDACRRVAETAERLTETAAGRPVLLRGANTADWVLQLLATQASGLLVVCAPEQAGRELVERFTALLGPVCFVDGGNRVILAGGPSRPAIPAAAEICLPTSGSTGTPRLALRSAASLLAEGERYTRLLSLGGEDTVLAALPVSHAFCLGLAVGGTLAAGCALRLLPRFAPRSLQRELRRHPPSVLVLVPAAARLLCSAWEKGAAPPAGLRHVVVGAGPVTEELDNGIRDCLGRRPARNYGSSETGTTLGTAGEEVSTEVTGYPLPGVEVEIMDGGSGSGALFVRTAAAFLGYLSDEGFDASRISPEGWYSTGDVARRAASGAIHIVGRRGNVLRRGERTVQPMELETVLRRHPGVSDAVVTGGVDGRGEEVIEAHVEVRPEARVDVPDLRGHLETVLEPYKIPNEWQLYRALPRTSAGKPDRSRLRRGATRGAEEAAFAVLACHRLSFALIAAQRLGVLDALADGGLPEELADRLEASAEGIGILLPILGAAGLVRRGNDGRYRLNGESWSPDFGPVVELESRLLRHHLCAENVERLLRGEGAGAPPPDAELAELYRRVMGRAARRIALHTWRRLRLPPGPIAEIGRPAGSFAAVAARREPERQVEVHDVPLEELPEIRLPQSALAGLFVYNVFRYLCGSDRGPVLEQLAGSLQPEGALAICDIFVDAPASTPWLRPALALDWAAFGSAAWRRGDDLCDELRELGLHRFERLRPDAMFDVIIARKPGLERRNFDEGEGDARDQRSSA